MIAQAGIAVFGVIAIWLTQSPIVERQRYACLFGLAAQPFWFWSAIEAGQWGVFALCWLYLAAWGRGFVEHWSAPLYARLKERRP
jgi:hypothetical protein